MDIKLLEGFHEKNLMYLYIVSLISADNLLTAKDCEKSIKYLKELEELIPQTSIPEEKKEEYLKFCEESLEICERDKRMFEDRLNDEEEVQP